MSIKIHKASEFKKMKKAGQYTAHLLNEIEEMIKPGVTTLDLDNHAAKFIEKYNLKSACLGYKGLNNVPFPKNICTSLNYVICHGIPNENIILKEGDILGVDITLILDGYHGDSCKTFKVGQVTKEVDELVDITKKAMEAGIEQAYHGSYLGNIGYSIQKFINEQKHKYSIVEEYCGHGIGTKFHQEPQVEHTGYKGTGSALKEGMFFTVEPMINMGSKHTKVLNDHWTVITKDYSLSAQFEHTIGIGPNGPEIFTLV